jgi:glycosyltransferase involved in cell wall biosynthesis
MDRKRILWLVSWYPNKTDAFDGDFIQRHAKAAALYDDIHVVFIKDAEQEEEREEEWRSANGLTEQIIYFRKPKGLFARIKKQITWRKIYLKAVKDYIREKGEPHLVHVHVPWKAGLIALALKKKFGLKYFITEHAGIYNDRVEDSFNSKSSLIKRFVKRVFREAEHFISVSRFLAESVNKMVVEKEYSVIPNVVDTSLFYHSDHKHFRFTFIHVSNMVPLKNVSGIVKAFQQFINKTGFDTQLILVGNKDDTYPREAEHSGLLNKTVFFKGEIPYTEVAKELQKAHCFILNSNIENSPCVIGEALCCGLPLIATEVGGVPELVDASNSILISPQSDDLLMNAMLQAYQNYTRFDQKQIAEKAASRFSFSEVGKQFHSFYAES